jgi:hypothetical protein
MKTGKLRYIRPALMVAEMRLWIGVLSSAAPDSVISLGFIPADGLAPSVLHQLQIVKWIDLDGDGEDCDASPVLN